MRAEVSKEGATGCKLLGAEASLVCEKSAGKDAFAPRTVCPPVRLSKLVTLELSH